ncbi:MAG: Trk system potassium transporter TrkA [Lachnospiraceae bacterium]|nr:Trk system potassium transporter TrkA [Lachnospiraceae bacterium]
MKIIIAGGGKVGELLTKKLSAEGDDLTIVDPDPLTLEKVIERYDVFGVTGNSASLGVLKQAGVQEADLMIATAGSDEINFLCCLSAHQLNPALRSIARVRNPEYLGQSYSMREIFGLSMTVNPERQAAGEIRRLLKYPGFLKRDTFAKGKVEIVELKLEEDSPLCNIQLKNLNSVVECKVLIFSVLREGKAVAPGGDFRLHAGDRIFVTAPSENLSALLRSLGIVTHKVRKVIIAGGGRTSYYLAEGLHKDGISVQIIEKDEDKCLALSRALPHAAIIQGDASSQNILESEGIYETDALVSLTGLDELNIIISYYGTVCNVPQIITKLNHVNNQQILEHLEVGSIIVPKELCATNIVRYVHAMKHKTGAAISIHPLADAQAEAVEFRVDSTTKHTGEELKSIRLKPGVLVCCITHGPETEIPNGNSVFRLNDTVIVVAPVGMSLLQLNDIFE